MMNKKYKVLIKDTFVFALGSFGSKFLLFLMVPLYTNYMSTEEYGTADLVFTIAQFLIPFFSLVIFDAVIRFGLSKDEKPEDVLLVGLIIFGIASAASIITAPLIGLYKPIAEWKWYLAFYVIFNIANSIELNYLKVKNQNKTYALLSVLQTGIMAGLNVWFLVYMHTGVQGYLMAYIIANVTIDVVAFIAGGMFGDLRKASLKHELFKEMVIYSTPLILNNVSWWVIHSSDKVMVEAIVGTVALGIYTVAAKIPSLINVFVTIFQQAWGISSVREIESTNDTSFYSSVFKVYSLLTSVACIFFVSIIKIFMQYYVGDEFQDAWRYVPLLLVSAVFAAVSSFYGSLYGALKKSVNNMVTTAIAAVINIVVNFIFIPTVGIWGAVIGTVVSYVVIAVVRMLDVERYIDISIDKGTFIINSVIVVVQAILVSLNIGNYIVSSVAIIICLVFNRNDIKAIIRRK